MDLIPVSEAAAEKNCTGQTIRNAIEQGQLHARRLGPRATMIVTDRTYERFRVKETGGRLHDGFERPEAEAAA